MQKLVLICLCVVISACSSSKGDMRILDDTLRSYASIIRWGDMGQASSFLEPDYLSKNPISRLDMERYQQVRVTGYREQPPQVIGEGLVRQLVQVEVANVHTQEVRSVIDVQEWRFDPESKRWWLTTGLPNISR